MRVHEDLREFGSVGRQISTIDVRISYRIIQLFSEGLYTSPNKAVEELVSNSFDAGATKVHVLLSPDLSQSTSTIAVLDNGVGMDPTGLKQHWLIGVSNKRSPDFVSPSGRKQIGKFGIGKLATYVLANRLTHVSRVGSKYYATTMDFETIPTGDDGGLHSAKPVSIPLKEMSESEARTLLLPWAKGKDEGFVELKLFGRSSAKSWTCAIMSSLKPKAADIQLGRLKWILKTAMPLRDDFRLYLNGKAVLPSKLKEKRIGKWVLGKDVTDLPRPAPDELQMTNDLSEKANSPKYWGLTHPKLGRITGYAELYDDLLTTGKSAHLERSNGFFVYVYDRLINLDDEYFGIDSNLLRHGTFSRFRAVIYIDKLDEELRSSRENVGEGALFNIARNTLHGIFNFVRARYDEEEKRADPRTRVGRRVADSPGSLTRRPIVALLQAAFAGTYTPHFLTYPQGLPKEDRDAFVQQFREESETSRLVLASQLVELSYDEVMAKFDVESRTLQINGLHPFVAYFRDAYEDQKRNLPLELLAMSEVLMEAALLHSGLQPTVVHDLVLQRDELLRYLANSAGNRNALMVSQDLMQAATDRERLELELVASFNSMGFDAIPLGGKGRPDGLASAYLAAKQSGVRRGYKVSLEAKSKEQAGRKVSAKRVGVSTIARQRDDYKCDHALVVGPDFPTSQKDASALLKEIESDRQHTGRTITLIRVVDLAKLVRLVPLKRVNLTELKSLFEDCKTPEESHDWVTRIHQRKGEKLPYREILETIWDEQNEEPSEAVEYGSLRTALRKSKDIQLGKAELIDLCRALSKMAPEFVHSLDNSIELDQRPDFVMDAISAVIREYPEDERDNKNLGVGAKSKKKERKR